MRAFNPVPGAFLIFDGRPIKVWRAEVLKDVGGTAGMVLAVGRQGIDVACGAAALRLTELQKAGGKRLPAAQFLAGVALRAGEMCRVGA